MAAPEVPPLDLTEPQAATKKMPAGLQKRASSAPKREKPPPPPITPRNKKASRSLFRELEGTVFTMRHARKRTEDMHYIVTGVMKELAAAVESAEKTLANNSKMVKKTKNTTPGELGKKPQPKSPTSALTVALRPFTEDEMQVLIKELRDKVEAMGCERDPTEDEIAEEVAARQGSRQAAAEAAERRVGSCNKGIVEALEKLRETSKAGIEELIKHEHALSKQMEELDKVTELLCLHKDARDALFDPLRSTDLPFARKAGTRPIERSILYQKMNLLPKNRDGTPLNIDWNDKDEEASEGKKMHEHFRDDKGHPGLTAHEATFAAAKEEDQARFVGNSALKAVRSAQSQLASRKSALQVAVLKSRAQVLKERRAEKSGKFGSSEERNTDPATRKMASNPEDSGG